MEKWIPYEKLSKKEQRKRDARRRTTRGALNPVTRKPENARAYNRRKARKWSDDSASVPLSLSGDGAPPTGRQLLFTGWSGAPARAAFAARICAPAARRAAA